MTTNGTASLSITSIAITGTNSGDFAISSNACGASLAAGANCSIAVTFKASAMGTRQAYLTVTDNALNSQQQSSSLTGNGTQPVPMIPITSLVFGKQNTNTPSASQTITVSNAGTGPLAITAVTLAGTNSADFSTCLGTNIVPNASCTISVTFKPTAVGPRSASISITDNAASSPQSVTLTGTGTSPFFSPSATSLTFGSQNIGGVTTSQTITVTNTGTGPLTITTIATAGTNPGDFTITADTCLTTVQPSATCTVSVAFKPTVLGPRAAALTFTDNVVITDNASTSPQSVALSGTGLQPVVTLSATLLTFGPQNVGTASAQQSVTLKNTGTEVLTLSSVALAGANPGDFVLSCGCGTTVAIGASCTLTVTFKPTATGTRNATVVLTDNAAASPQSIKLTGTGTAPVATLSPMSINFGTVAPFTTSPAQTVTLTNSGTGAMSISSIGLTGANVVCFSITGKTCGTSLAVGASCTVSVVYKPTNSKAQAANLTFTDNAAGSPQSVALSGQ